MLIWGKGTIEAILEETDHKQVVLLRTTDGRTRKGINYTSICGNCKQGDLVAYNATAYELGLGTGGYDFIIANITSMPINRPLPEGHIIKNRYTPIQIGVKSGEEKDHPLYSNEIENGTIAGVPVLIINLHSMLPIIILALKKEMPNVKIVYVMTDGTSLPIWLSTHVDRLRESNLLAGTVTYGQSFGGDIEAVNKFSALLVAKFSLKGDIIVIGSGPGSLGTGSKWGFSGIEVGEIINAVHILKGTPIVVPRISFADQRNRHYGISHHTITALCQAALAKAYLSLPILESPLGKILQNQVKLSGIDEKHFITWNPPPSLAWIKELISSYPISITTMGRGIHDDPVFFQNVALSALFAKTFLA